MRCLLRWRLCRPLLWRDRLAASLLVALFTAATPGLRAQPASTTCPPAAQAPTTQQVQAAQAAARDRGFLWRVSKGERTSWLYGTVHLGRLDWLFPGPKVRAALAQADTLALELDITDPATVQAVNAQFASQRGSFELTTALAERLARQVAAACIPARALDQQHPVMRAVTLVVLAARWDGLDPGYAQEIVLASAARAAQMPVVALETVAEQLGALIPVDPVQARSMLEQMLAQLEDGSARRTTARLAQAWAQGRLEELAQYEEWCDCVKNEKTSEENRAFMRRINDERNPALAQRIDALHGGGQRVFAAVGALHMTGPQALPALLVARGYTVERVVFAP